MFCLEELHEAEGGGRRSWRGSRLGKRWQLWREGGYLYGCKRTGLLYILIDDLTSLNQTFLVSVSKVWKSPSLFHANSDKVGIFGDSSPFFQIHLCLICKVCWWAYDHILQVHQPRVQPPLEGINNNQEEVARNFRYFLLKEKTMSGVKTSPEVCAQVGQLLLDPKRPLKER